MGRTVAVTARTAQRQRIALTVALAAVYGIARWQAPHHALVHVPHWWWW